MTTYVRAFQIAQIAKLHRERIGDRYFSGVERAAALAAVDAGPDRHGMVDAMAEVFERFKDRCSKWDGSIA